MRGTSKFDPWIHLAVLALITGFGIALRLWRFREGGELLADEAYFANVATGFWNRESIWGWESLLRFKYGIGFVSIIAVWEKMLLGVGLPFNEVTMHLPQVVLGILLIWIAYAMVKMLTSKGPALAVAALVAVMPVHVAQSRSIAHWTVSACLSFFLIYLFLMWQRRDKWYVALLTGVALATYIQTDILQLVLLAFIPVLLWLLADRGTVQGRRWNNGYASAVFGVILLLGGILLHPEILQHLFPHPVHRWSAAFMTKIEAIAWVTMAYAWAILLLISSGFWKRLSGKALFVWNKLTNPWFLIPASTSFLVALWMAVGSWVETGIPQGVLGHAFSKEEGALGWYGWLLIQDLITVCGGPVVVLIALGLILLPLSIRKDRGIRILVWMSLITNIPWLFLVSPAYGARETYMLISSTALVSLSICSLWNVFGRLAGSSRGQRIWSRRSLIASIVISLVCVLTLPFTLSRLEQRPVLGIGPYGNNTFGSIHEATGNKEAFEYVRMHVGDQEKVFTNFAKNKGRYYLERPFGKKHRGRVIGVFSSRDSEAATLLRSEGRQANWYVVSKSFRSKYSQAFDSRMNLRAVARATGDSTEVWQRNYTGSVEGLTVLR